MVTVPQNVEEQQSRCRETALRCRVPRGRSAVEDPHGGLRCSEPAEYNTQ